MVALPEQAQQAAYRRERKDVPSIQAFPDVLKASDAVTIRLRRKMRSVDCSDGRADHEIRNQPMPHKRLEHADLNRPQAAAACEHESGALGVRGGTHGFRGSDSGLERRTGSPELPVHELPVDLVQEGLHVLRPLIAKVEVVRLLPYLAGEHGSP